MEILEGVIQYDWVPFYKNLVNAIGEIAKSTATRDSLLKEKAALVFTAEHAINKTPEIDPLSFIYAVAQRSTINQREIVYPKLVAAFQLTEEIPSDYFFPTPPPNNPVLFSYNNSYVTKDGNPVSNEVLWNLFVQAADGQLNENDFKEVLSLKGVRITKLSQVLFLINPKAFWSIDEISLWLPLFSEQERSSIKQQIEEKGLQEYLRVLQQIGAAFPNCRFYEINMLSGLLMGTDPYLKLTGNYCQISSKIEGGNGKDYFNEFVEENAVWPGDGGTMNLTYDLQSVNDGDIVLVRRGTRQLGGIGVVVVNEYKGKGYDADLAIYIVWLNKESRKLEYGVGDWKGFNARATADTYEKFYSKYSDTLELIKKIQALQKDEVYEEPAEHYTTITSNTKSAMSALNTILYGPPGTGKTYKTIQKAVEIITGESFEGRYEEAKAEYKKQFGKQVEFITFHQNYSYEDFVAGLRPDVAGDANGLKFKEHRGVFYRICQRATKNWLQHKQYLNGSTYIEPLFEEVLNEFLKPLIEEDEPIVLNTIARNIPFNIFAVNAKNLGLEKQSGSREHTLSINTLRNLYDGSRDYDLQGLGVYMYPVVDRLKQIAVTLRKPVTEVKLENYVLIIDEINRANISRVFGELITLLEEDKRLGATHELQLSLPGLPDDEPFAVPPNLYIIGTMNTADKSIALLDIALRRRFQFEGIYPDASLPNVQYADILTVLNEQIMEKKGSDFLIGHSFFMKSAGKEFDLAVAMNQKVIPLLNEYFYNQKGDVVKSIIEKAIAVHSNMKLVKDSFGQLQFSVF